MTKKQIRTFMLDFFLTTHTDTEVELAVLLDGDPDADLDVWGPFENINLMEVAMDLHYMLTLRCGKEQHEDITTS